MLHKNIIILKKYFTTKPRTCTTTGPGVRSRDTEAVTSVISSAESVAESSTVLARADLRGDTAALGEGGAEGVAGAEPGAGEADKDLGLDGFVIDSDL